ncbi:MAG TPA: hypothetical protein VJ732_06195 [Bryobacteraceae bacterium]|nr:hypothetical protein [Bryobacteraceae bacterium]
MSTLRQIEANRRNARSSTGPRSAEGKAVSRFNALKSGIHAQAEVIPGEDPAELEALTADYHRQFQPAAPLEVFLVDALVHADWQLRRLRRVEAQLWQHRIEETQRLGFHLSENTPLGQIYQSSADFFTRLQRRIDAAERSYYRALKELQKLQAAAGPLPEEAGEPEAAPEAPEPSPAELGSFFPCPGEPSETPAAGLLDESGRLPGEIQHPRRKDPQEQRT